MVKMVSFKKTAADKREEKDALGEPQTATADFDHAVTMHLDHHHLAKLGISSGMKSGEKCEFHGRGVVENSHTSSDKGGDRHSATLRFSHGWMDHEAPRGGDEERRSVRGDLEKAYAGVQEKGLPDKKSSGPAK
jgi:hypothetical protein